MSSALFGNSVRSSSKNLVEFKAGKMIRRGKMVHPDERKGLVYIYQSDDTLMHFCWKERTTGSVVENLIIFPEDCEFKKVTQCTSGRVYVLKFKSSERKCFFWMQEPKTDKDEEYSRKVNEYLNNPPTTRSSSSTPNPVLGSSDLSNLQNSDIHNFIGNISQQQLMQILGSGVPSLASLLGPNAGRNSSGSGSTNTTSASNSSSTTSSSSSTTTTTTSISSTLTSGGTTTTSTSGRSIQLSDLQNILSGISVPPEATERVPVDLGSMMTSEALKPILTNEEFVEKLKPYLPSTSEKLPPVEELRGTVASPQFQSAVSLFTTALQSGGLGPLINQFGLGDEAVTAATSCDMEAFIKALAKNKEEKGSKKEEEKKKEKDQDKDEDDSMALD